YLVQPAADRFAEIVLHGLDDVFVQQGADAVTGCGAADQCCAHQAESASACTNRFHAIQVADERTESLRTGQCGEPGTDRLQSASPATHYRKNSINGFPEAKQLPDTALCTTVQLFEFFDTLAESDEQRLKSVSNPCRYNYQSVERIH